MNTQLQLMHAHLAEQHGRALPLCFSCRQPCHEHQVLIRYTSTGRTYHLACQLEETRGTLLHRSGGAVLGNPRCYGCEQLIEPEDVAPAQHTRPRRPRHARALPGPLRPQPGLQPPGALAPLERLCVIEPDARHCHCGHPCMLHHGDSDTLADGRCSGCHRTRCSVCGDD